MSEEKKQKKEVEKQKRKQARKGFIDNFAPSVLKEIITGKKDLQGESEYIQQFYASREYVMKPKLAKYSKKELRIFIALGMILLNMLILCIRYFYAFFHLRTTIITNNLLYLLTATILPFVAWVIATNENFWAFHKRKRQFFAICAVNSLLVLCQPFYTLIAKLAVFAINKIPINPLLTQRMVNFLGNIIIITLFALFIHIVFLQFEPLLLSENLKRDIEQFKLQYVKDDRENREYKYDNKTFKNLETGKTIVIKENDRFVQGEINGASGTGKTSTVFENGIRDDLDQKVKNRDKRQEELLRMIENKEAIIKGPLKEFTESAIIAVGKNEKELKKNKEKIDKIRKKYPDCGMTIVAPNASMAEHVIRMCEARDVKVNMLDPMHDFEQYGNVIPAAINPFYIPLGLPEQERAIRISEAATVFSDVLIATNQMAGDADTYFTDIALSVSSNISSIVMLAKNINGEQASIDDVQECISNFENLRPYVAIVEKTFNISVEASQTGSSGTKLDADSVRLASKNATYTQRAAAKRNPYYHQILFIKQELLGAGAEDMFSQSRGLRNLINKILADQRIKKKLSAEDDVRIDFDRILANNEITLVNTAIELGQNISTSFGLFFLLLHRASVLRRPEETRTPHFLWVDECAQYVHPFFDDVIALYRQYRVAAMLTLQTLTQLEKRSSTAYLKNVFLGAGTHVVFGRLAPEEMKLYSAMSGLKHEITEQKSTTENSVFASNPTYTEGSRTTKERVTMLEGADMRILGFLELTIFTINSGRVLPGQLARVFFIGNDAFEKQPSPIDFWEKIAPEAFKWNKEEEQQEKPENKNQSTDTEKEDTADKNIKIKTVPYKDTIPDDVTKEQVMTQYVPKQEQIEEEEDSELSLQELYRSLMGYTGSENKKPVNTEHTDDQGENDYDEEEFDYAAASRQYNSSRRE